MKNKKIILEEINQIQYLFGYKRGVVISEQTDPNALKKVEMVQSMKEKETDPNMIALYDSLIEYYTKLSKGESATSPDERYTNYIDSKFTTQTPELPKTKTEPNMPLLGNLAGEDLTSAYNVLIGYFSRSKDFDGMSAFSTLLHNREKQISMKDLQKYLDEHASINLESVYASITDKSTFEREGKNISPK